MSMKKNFTHQEKIHNLINTETQKFIDTINLFNEFIELIKLTNYKTHLDKYTKILKLSQYFYDDNINQRKQHMIKQINRKINTLTRGIQYLTELPDTNYQILYEEIYTANSDIMTTLSKAYSFILNIRKEFYKINELNNFQSKRKFINKTNRTIVEKYDIIQKYFDELYHKSQKNKCRFPINPYHYYNTSPRDKLIKSLAYSYAFNILFDIRVILEQTKKDPEFLKDLMLNYTSLNDKIKEKMHIINKYKQLNQKEKNNTIILNNNKKIQKCFFELFNIQIKLIKIEKQLLNEVMGEIIISDVSSAYPMLETYDYYYRNKKLQIIYSKYTQNELKDIIKEPIQVSEFDTYTIQYNKFSIPSKFDQTHWKTTHRCKTHPEYNCMIDLENTYDLSYDYLKYKKSQLNIYNKIQQNLPKTTRKIHNDNGFFTISYNKNYPTFYFKHNKKFYKIYINTSDFNVKEISKNTYYKNINKSYNMTKYILHNETTIDEIKKFIEVAKLSYNDENAHKILLISLCEIYNFLSFSPQTAEKIKIKQKLLKNIFFLGDLLDYYNRLFNRENKNPNSTFPKKEINITDCGSFYSKILLSHFAGNTKYNKIFIEKTYNYDKNKHIINVYDKNNNKLFEIDPANYVESIIPKNKRYLY